MPDQIGDLSRLAESDRIINTPTLAEVIAGQTRTCSDDRQVSCFLNYRGLDVQFAALGHVVYNRAVELGIGRDLPSDWFTEDDCP